MKLEQQVDSPIEGVIKADHISERFKVFLKVTFRTENHDENLRFIEEPIESLLTKQGHKYTDILPRRIEAFIGWVGYWDDNSYNARIKSVYLNRCQYVHDGNDSHIEIKNLLLNILLNLLSHHKIFNSKEEL